MGRPRKYDRSKTFTCQMCGCSFQPKYWKKTPPSTCSMKCRNEKARDAAVVVTRAGGAWKNRARKPKPVRQCDICGKQYQPNRKESRFCSLVCVGHSQSTGKRGAPRWKVYFPQCVVCGELFTARSGSQKMCSDKCRLTDASRRLTSLYQLTIGTDEIAYYWRSKLVSVLRKRDGDNCVLCAQQIDFTLKSGPQGSDDGYSIEHLTPRSTFVDRAEADTWDNLALSHWGCNRKRGTKPLHELERAG